MARYLVIQLARFGDLVQTKRLIRSLEGRGEVHLCMAKGLEGVAALLYPKAVLHVLPVHSRPDADSVQILRQVMARLRTLSFTTVYNLNHAGINRALARLFAPEQVRGYSMDGGQALRSSWVRMAFRWTGERPMAPVNLVDFWAFFDEQPCAPSQVNPAASPGGRGLGVVLAGRESRRSLPPPVLVQVVRTAFESLGGPAVFLLGSAGERPLARQLVRHLPGNMLDKVQDLSGKTDWQGLAEALTGLDALITPDTGTMHLAAHLGVPVQAFFLSSALCHETGPYGAGHTVWQSVHPCAPCLESSPCSLGVACLEDFSSRSLLRGLAATLGNSQGGQGVWACSDKALPEGLTCQRSLLDELGSYWQVLAGQDPYEGKRRALRALMAEYRGFPQQNRPAGMGELAHMIYDEADWMLLQPQRPQWEV